MSRTDRKTAEQLMNAIGNVKEQYVREYMEAQSGIPDRKHAWGQSVPVRSGFPWRWQQS